MVASRSPKPSVHVQVVVLLQNINLMYDYRTTDLVALHIFKKQQLEEMFQYKIPTSILEGLDDNPRRDVLLEWLNTHNAQELIDKLHKEFGEDISIRTQHDRGIDGILIQKDDRTEDIFMSNKAKEIMDAYGYQFDKEDAKYLLYHPKMSSNAKDLVYGKCHGVVYHITLLKNFQSISEKGIRAKHSTYRNFSDRIYCFVAPPEYNYNLKLSIDEVLAELNWNISKKELAVIKINLGGNNVIDFYQDDAMMCDTACYTFSNIPKEYIKWIKPLAELC